MDREGFRNRLKQYKKAREENPGLKYYDFMERLAEFKAKEWNDDSDMVLLHMLNDNSYNYQQMYEDNPNFDIQEGHFVDTYKTAYHPTFSEESMYSGKKSPYNPEGIIGGSWNESTKSFYLNDRRQSKRKAQDYLNHADPGYRAIPKYDDGGGVERIVDTVDLSKIVDYKGRTAQDEIDRVTTLSADKEEQKTLIDYEKKWIESLLTRDDGIYSVDMGILPEVIINPTPIYVTLRTEYPFVNESTPWTGHSALYTPDLCENVDIGGKYENYNLFTNNCSNATKRVLERTFGKEYPTYLFTTPGDVLDFAVDELNARELPTTEKGVRLHKIRLTPELSKRLRYETYRENRNFNNKPVLSEKDFYKRFLGYKNGGVIPAYTDGTGGDDDPRAQIVNRANEVASNYDNAEDFDLSSVEYGIRKLAKNWFGRGGISNCTLSATGWIDPNNQYMSARNIFNNPNSGYVEIDKEYALPGDLLISKNPEKDSYHTMLIEGFNDNEPLLRYSRGGHDTEENLVKSRPLTEYHRLDNEQGGNHTEDHYFRYMLPNEFWLPEITITAPRKIKNK